MNMNMNVNTDLVTYAKLYSKRCQYLIKTNQMSVHTQPTAIQLSELSDRQVSYANF